jgi:hypothetical protein
METEIAYRFFNRFKDDHFCLAYMGEFDDELTESLIRTNESSVQEPQKFKKRLSFLIAECFQNIIRHADKPEILTQTNNKPKIFALRNIGNSHYISSTNLIENTKKEELEEKLNSINTLTAEKLKQIYLEALVNNEISAKGGGGLGLIEMARKSGSPLKFAFEFVNYFYSVFYIQVRFIAQGDTPDPTQSDVSIHIDETKDLYNQMLTENVFMIRKGDFSQESILPLITLIEGNLKLQTNFSGSKKKTLYMLVEMLQNISKHGVLKNGEREGIFMISQKNNHYVLTAGNYIESDAIPVLKEKLENTIHLDKDQLNKAYKDALFNSEPSINGNAGIGLIELCKYSTEKISYTFTTINEKLSFFSLSITV